MAKFNLKDGENLYIDNATLNMILNTYDPTAIKNMLRRALERQRTAEAKLKNPPNCGSGVNPPTLHIDGREAMRHASIKPSDNATTAGLRPCYVGARKALFHKWEKKQTASPLGGMLEFTVALVEFENGSIETRNPQHIRFADSAGLFKQFAFDEEREAKT